MVLPPAQVAHSPLPATGWEPACTVTVGQWRRGKYSPATGLQRPATRFWLRPVLFPAIAQRQFDRRCSPPGASRRPVPRPARQGLQPMSAYLPLVDESQANRSAPPQYVVVSIPAGTSPGSTLQATTTDGKCFAFKVLNLLLSLMQSC
jgi:hypothetical protein